MPTERVGNADIINSTDGLRIIHQDGKKFRLYGKDGALKGVYDTQREAEKKARRFMPIDEEQDLPKRVSTRNPTAKKSPEDPLAHELSINIDAIKQIQGALPKIVKKLQRYDGPALTGKTSEEKIAQFKEFLKDNLLFLYDLVPAATRERSSNWYDGARKISVVLGSQYKLSTEAVAGVLASLSPQMDWYKNVSLAKRVLSIVTQESKPAFNGEMLKWAENATGKNSKGQTVKVIRPEMVESMRGKKYDDMSLHQKAVYVRAFDEAHHPREYNVISPEGDELGIALNADGQRTASKVAWGSLLPIMKSIKILENPTRSTISEALGNEHKVRSFFNNIIVPNNPKHGDVTIDTHAVAAGLLLPLSGSSKEVAHSFGSGMPGSSVHGVSGTYGIIADGYREAAAARGVLPRQMQSITWEAIRGLFSPAFKRSKGVDQVRKIWKSYKEGKATLNDTRSNIINLAGGITAPTWE